MAQKQTVSSLQIVTGSLSEVEADLLVVGCFQGEPLSGPASALSEDAQALVRSLADGGSLKARPFDAEWIYPAPGATRRIQLLGCGKPAEYDVRVARRLASAAARTARIKKAGRLCIALPELNGMGLEKFASVVADGIVTGLFGSNLYKESPNQAYPEHVLVWTGKVNEGLAAGLEKGRRLGEEVNFGRWLGDEPSNIMTPSRFSDELVERAASLGVECAVLDEAAIRAADMMSLLSVSQGSAQPPRVVVLRYNGGSGPLTAFVGKGVTFDTGGISIKPATDMHYMKYDMCGAATAASALFGLAATGAKANALAVVGLVENMPSANATRPGDVVRAANGKTIEIINTDAEGRLVLADVLDLARKRGAERLVDIATLTGAMKVSLGTVATGAMGTPDEWLDEVVAASQRAGERIWPMPLYPEYFELLKSNIADMTNSGGRFGGGLAAAKFLQQFVGDTPWVHLDVAGTAYTEKDHPWQLKGATGAMARTLVELATPST
jgi:leucyl aminopeptidase